MLTGTPTRKKHAHARFGRANGKRTKNSGRRSPNQPGWLVSGSARAPPITGPMMLPKFQMSGMTEKARGRSACSGTISATMVRMMPTLPLTSPENIRAKKAIASDVLKPNSSRLVKVVSRPINTTGLRPMRSDMRPHRIPVKHWLSENEAARRPA